MHSLANSIITKCYFHNCKETTLSGKLTHLFHFGDYLSLDFKLPLIILTIGTKPLTDAHNMHENHNAPNYIPRKVAVS